MSNFTTPEVLVALEEYKLAIEKARDAAKPMVDAKEVCLMTKRELSRAQSMRYLEQTTGSIADKEKKVTMLVADYQEAADNAKIFSDRKSEEAYLARKEIELAATKVEVLRASSALNLIEKLESIPGLQV